MSHHWYIRSVVKQNLRTVRRLAKSFGTSPGAMLDGEQFVGGVLVPFVLLDSTLHLVFEKRAENIRQPGEISFTGGRFDRELDRSTRDTAVRETVEELGIPRKRVVAFRRVGTVMTGHAAAVDVYPGILRIASLSELAPAAAEVAEVFTVPFSHFVEHDPDRYTVHDEVHSFYTDKDGQEVFTFPARELGLPDRYHRSWGRREQTVLCYPWEKHQIWGMTARIIYSLVLSCRCEFKIPTRQVI